MIIVHEIYVCKPGNASKVAKKFKAAMEGMPELVNILTDRTGQFNRVIAVTKYESLADYERNWERYEKDSEAMKKMNAAMEGFHDMYVSGSREIYNVW